MTTVKPPTPWDDLPLDIRETWKIDPNKVLTVRRLRGATYQFEALTATHRYVWTFIPSRRQYAVKKTSRV